MNLPRFSVNNPVAANLLMIVIIVGGFISWQRLLREFFPNITPEQARIQIRYPGASPEEVEKTVTRRVEQELKNVRDIEKVACKVVEGLSMTTVTFEDNVDGSQLIDDIRNAIDRAKVNFPKEIEEPHIEEIEPLIPVIAVVVYGDVSEERLREEAKRVRDDLLEFPEISEIFVGGLRKREIWIEIDPERMEEFTLTHEEVGRVVALSNLDLPGGKIRSSYGNINVRTSDEQKQIVNLEQIVLRNTLNAQEIRLKDIARLWATFEDIVNKGRFADKSAMTITVFKSPDQDAIKIADIVKQYMKKHPQSLGGAVNFQITTDISRFISQRLELMLRNARFGFILVVLCLALFLDLRVALWVASGMVTAFMGTFILMHVFNVTINLISLFGLLIVLGMLVDDAIVVGENIFTHMRRGVPLEQAAIEGSNEVAIPVVGAVLTTVAAFVPLMFLEGRLGDMISDVPKVVLTALSISILEAFLILPAHLAYRSELKVQNKMLTSLQQYSSRIGEFKLSILETIVPKYVGKVLYIAARWRYVTIALVMGLAMVVAGLVAGGKVPFVLFQKVDAEMVSIDVEMSAGTIEKRTEEVVTQIEQIAHSCPEVTTVFSILGVSYSEEGSAAVSDPATVSQITIELLSAEDRERKKMRTCEQVINFIRSQTSEIPGLKRIGFLTRSGGPGGADIEILVKGKIFQEVAQTVGYIREELRKYQGITSIEDDLVLGKREIRFQLRESARALGLTTSSIALQIRHALFGFEAQKLQEEDEEVTVRVLLPENWRHNLSDLEKMRISTPSGMRVPLEEVAILSTSRGYASLSRMDGKRAVTIKAQVDEDRANVSQITDNLAERFANIDRQFPGVSISFEGRKKETRESIGSLAIGFPVALLLIYSIIAVVFKSYVQPLIIMFSIPYGVMGAILGHVIMGYPVTFLSLIGAVALSGIVVNDSIVMVDFINRRRREVADMYDAVVMAATSRVRAIFLTSSTTILGLVSLLFEQSFQAQFLIPMAISIVFGLAMSSFLTLFLVPCLYLVLEDIKNILRWMFYLQRQH